MNKEKKMKKKVISLVIDTELTNEQIEKGGVHLEIHGDVGPSEQSHWPKRLRARSVRVLDSDEIK